GRIDPILVPLLIGASGSQAGFPGLPPRPAAGEHVAFLRGDGTWARPNNRYVESWRTSWAAGNVYTASHGLGKTPEEYWAELECVTVEYGYAVGDRVRIQAFGEQGTSRGATVFANSTNVGISISAAGVAIARRDSTAIGVVTPANWKLRLVAQAWWI
ncbi:MAG: hypothetical protein CUN48_16275, partial [Candidatus Thermofonsia Clade 3 bacterium]